MIKLLILFFGVAISLNAQNTNIFNGIIERNAFNLTEEKPIKIMPPATNILSSNLYLTGITRLNGVRKVHLVVKKPGKLDKFISLLENQAQGNIELKKVTEDSVLISSNNQDRFLSFEKHSLPTVIIKAPPKLMQRSDKKRQNDERGKKSK
jgi:hypothetical protein